MQSSHVVREAAVAYTRRHTRAGMESEGMRPCAAVRGGVALGPVFQILVGALEPIHASLRARQGKQLPWSSGSADHIYEID